jgi:hypothetical protein
MCCWVFGPAESQEFFFCCGEFGLAGSQEFCSIQNSAKRHLHSSKGCAARHLVQQRVKNYLIRVLPHATLRQGCVVGYLASQKVKNSSLLGVLPHATYTYTQVKVVLWGILSCRESRILPSSEFCLTAPTLR